ncbi:MAG: hypothetical protein ACYSUI_19045, partial [Planctomycetota bacterium]
NNGLEVLIGSRTVSQVSSFTVGDNSVTCLSSEDDTIGAPLVLALSASQFNGTVSNNRLTSNNINIMQVWNLALDPTQKATGLTVTGNFCFSDKQDAKGFAAYTDMGATNGGNIGSFAISHWFTMTGNTIPNTSSGTDYTHSTANKCVVQDNNE